MQAGVHEAREVNLLSHSHFPWLLPTTEHKRTWPPLGQHATVTVVFSCLSARTESNICFHVDHIERMLRVPAQRSMQGMSYYFFFNLFLFSCETDE